MKRMIYQVCLGRQKNSKLYQTCIESVHSYCERFGIDHIVQSEATMRIKPDIFAGNRSQDSFMKHGGFLPIFEKENAFDFFDFYDQIAIVDADIWIRPGAPNLFDQIPADVDFAGVLERDQPSLPWHAQKLGGYSRMQYGHHSKFLDFDWKGNVAAFYNMGMMLMNKSITQYMKGMTPKEFITQDRFKPFVDGQGPWKWSTDQTLLNVWIREDGVKTHNLDWKWNALYSAISDKDILRAHFVHFFLKDKLPGGGENVDELMKRVTNG
jgi:hypothetical protein